MGHSSATTKKSGRRLDEYFTPASATEELCSRVCISGEVLECCAGEGGIADVIDALPDVQVWRNDIVTGRPKQTHQFNAALSVHWAGLSISSHWVISNPPFNQAAQILPLAYEHAQVGMAMLLRLSFLEPTKDRGLWLNEHPPTQMIVLPRISFTGDGKTDSVTCAWMIWEKDKAGTIAIAKNRKFANAG